MRKTAVALLLSVLLFATACSQQDVPSEVTLSKDELFDKIKGGWAGQTIGVVYGAPRNLNSQGQPSRTTSPYPGAGTT